MSTWRYLLEEEITIDGIGQEVDLLVGSDYMGNIYSTLTFDQIKEIYKKITNDDRET